MTLTRAVFRWEVLDRYMAAFPTARFSLHRVVGPGGRAVWKAGLFQGAKVVALAEDTDRDLCLLVLFQAFMKGEPWERP